MLKLLFYIEAMCQGSKWSAGKHISNPINKTDAFSKGLYFVIMVPKFIRTDTLFVDKRMTLTHVFDFS